MGFEQTSDASRISAMQLIDSHCHLDDSRFDADRSEVLVRARKAGLDGFIVPAVSRSGWQKLKLLSEQNRRIHPAFGLHPWFFDQHTYADLTLLPDYLEQAVAVGECGLDAGGCKTAMHDQLYWFRAQLGMAADHDLPVIIHAVKTIDIVVKELKNFPQLTGVVHSFHGNLQQADALMASGLYLGIGSAITRPQNVRLQETARNLPLERLLIETDAPDQTPAKHQGERNEPAFLIEIAQQLASLRGLPTAELVAACNANTKELFRI